MLEMSHTRQRKGGMGMTLKRIEIVGTVKVLALIVDAVRHIDIKQIVSLCYKISQIT